MDTRTAIAVASQHLTKLTGHEFDLLNVTKPVSPEAALNLAKVVSKLSPILGNLIEFNTVEFLNDLDEFDGLGKWIRQDPGFPDALFEGSIRPAPGFEIKAWFPLATEITARFKDSQNHFLDDRTYVCLIAWLPEHLIYGKPFILDVMVTSGAAIAKSRDDHYHNPPDYLVLEPQDTTNRTRNLQQTNTNGYKFQGTPEQFKDAEKLVRSWGQDARVYQPTPGYQRQLQQLIAGYSYRLDTNFAKVDRIVNKEIEAFKAKVMRTNVHGMTVKQWSALFSKGSDDAIRNALSKFLDIKDVDAAEKLVR
ncbi:hypothetical protein GOE09_20005 [Sinorhizobium medicae]|nr:hypothetical protein [Sinorhizobium medicae]